MRSPLPGPFERRLLGLADQWRHGMMLDEELTSEVVTELERQLDSEQAPRAGRATRRADLLSDALVHLDLPLPVLVELAVPAFQATSPDRLSRLQELADAVLVTTLHERGPVGLEPIHSLGVAVASRGALPRGVREAVRDAPPQSGVEWIELTAAVADHDAATVLRVVERVGRLGCVGPARLAADTWTGPEPEQDVMHDIVRVLDLEALRAQHRWGAITEIAVMLAAVGADDAAAEWSAAVDADDVPGFRTRAPDRPHSPCCRGGCREHDARLFGPLALVRHLVGDPHGAAAHAARGTLPGGDWGSAGHEAVAAWVATRSIPDPTERLRALDAIRPRHSWLGLLRGQISLDQASLARAGAVHRPDREVAEIADALAHPRMSLHFGFFPYDDLLTRLPVARLAWRDP